MKWWPWGFTSRKKRANACEARNARNRGEQAGRQAFWRFVGREKQRVSLARCFCQDANLLLMDEPSSFLDVEFMEEFVQMMHALPKYMASIVVTHDTQLTQALGWPIVRLSSPIVKLGALCRE